MSMTSLIKQFLDAKGRDWSGSTLKHNAIQEICRHLVEGKNDFFI